MSKDKLTFRKSHPHYNSAIEQLFIKYLDEAFRKSNVLLVDVTNTYQGHKIAVSVRNHRSLLRLAEPGTSAKSLDVDQRDNSLGVRKLSSDKCTQVGPPKGKKAARDEESDDVNMGVRRSMMEDGKAIQSIVDKPMKFGPLKGKKKEVMSGKVNGPERGRGMMWGSGMGRARGRNWRKGKGRACRRVVRELIKTRGDVRRSSRVRTRNRRWSRKRIWESYVHKMEAQGGAESNTSLGRYVRSRQ